jgi:hypothetical protein
LKAVTAHPAAAVVLSAVIFVLGHGYEGSAGVVTVGAMELAFALSTSGGKVWLLPW